MTYFDVFNGDADGICALHQLRLAEPVESQLVTGVKRDISLLKRVEAGEGDQVTVLDISLDKNRKDLERLLARGVRVRYFDHHFAGDIPVSDRLDVHIETAPDVCTSLLVDRHLGGRFRPWAVAAAFGDNLEEAARRAAEPLGLDETALGRLRELGMYMNYNAYGATVDDLFFPPDALFRRLQRYASPLDFIAGDEAFPRLRDGYADDMAQADALRPEVEAETHAVYVLPAEPWARRVSGVFGNQLARNAPSRAHAVVTRLPDGGYMVSVRAPLTRKEGADELCRQFPTGGGRKGAAGINHLPEERFGEFVAKFRDSYA